MEGFEIAQFTETSCEFIPKDTCSSSSCSCCFAQAEFEVLIDSLNKKGLCGWLAATNDPQSSFFNTANFQFAINQKQSLYLTAI